MSKIVIFGATGYAGRLVAESLVKRGAKPVIAGRNEKSLQKLSDELGGLEIKIADASSVEEVSQLIGPNDVLVATVGPFEKYGYAAAQAAAETGSKYLDSTGELGFVLDLSRKYESVARRTGAMLLPAFGYDYVPGFLAALAAFEKSDEPIDSLDIAYFATPLSVFNPKLDLSSGTKQTLLDGLTGDALVWKDHDVHTQPFGSQSMGFPLDGSTAYALLASGTEVVDLPALFPSIENVAVYNGWVNSRLAGKAMPLARALLKCKATASLIHKAARGFVGKGGPDAERRSVTRSTAVAKAKTKDGKSFHVTVQGPSIYNLTGELLAEGALFALEHDPCATGVVNPISAFGSDALKKICSNAGMGVK